MATLDPEARTDATSVKEIVETDLGDTLINAFINSAHRLVEDNLTGKGLSEAALTEIELWLSAHFLSMRDQRAASVNANGLSVTFQGKTDMGLKATLYGQQALALDSSGTLATMGQKRAILKVY